VTARFELVEEQPRFELMADEEKPLAANAGLANLAANVLGLPGEAVKNVANLAIAGYGTAKRALTGSTDLPELISSTRGDVGDVKRMLRATGEPGLNPDNPAPGDKKTTLAYELTSRGAMLPQGLIPSLGSIIAEELGGPQWAGVGALLPQAAITAYNAARAPSLARQEAENAVRDKTLADAKAEGYVVPPSASGQAGVSGFVSRRLESIGGKAAVGQEASVRNQRITNAIARRELGLTKTAPLSEQTLEAHRERLARPYREVAAMDQEAAAALEKLKKVRFDANNEFKFYDRSANPEALAKARELSTEAVRLERYLEDIAKNAGKPEVVAELRQARTQIAKTYDVERALNLGSGDVAAKDLGRAMDAGKPLSGGLATAGRFAQGFQSYAKEGATIPTPGVSKSEALASALLGVGGYAATGSPYGAAAAALPLLSGPARSLVLSGPYQWLSSPSYRPALRPEPNAQALLRLGILAPKEEE
jgi:hypothetical protein